MAKDIEELKTRSMRDNVIFHNIPETKDEEDLKGAVAASMLKMGLDLSGIEYDRIHRLGPATPNNKPRAIGPVPLERIAVAITSDYEIPAFLGIRK